MAGPRGLMVLTRINQGEIISLLGEFEAVFALSRR